MKGVKVAAEHDFLSGDRLFAARGDNAWTPETIPNLSGIGLVQDPAVCYSAGIEYLVFVADTVRYETPVRGLFYSTSTDDGATWTQPTALYYDQVYSAVHRPTLASRDSVVYVGWQSALRSEENAQVLVGHFRNGAWQGTVPVLPGTRAPEPVRQGRPALSSRWGLTRRSGSTTRTSAPARHTGMSAGVSSISRSWSGNPGW